MAIMGCICLYSCQQNEEIVNPQGETIGTASGSVEENVIYYYDTKKDEQVTFYSMEEFAAYFEGTEHYEMVSAKIAMFEEEKAFVEEHRLYELPEDHALIKAYMERIEGPSVAKVEVAFGAFLYDGTNGTGERMSSTSTPAPSIRRRWRNRASSVQGGIGGGGGLILCDRTWYRGPYNFVLVAPLLSSNLDGSNGTTNFNNRTESFY